MARKFIARIECYVEIVIPVEKRLEFNIYQAHRAVRTSRAEGYYISSATPREGIASRSTSRLKA